MTNSNLKVLLPEDFTASDKQHITNLETSIHLLSSCSDIVMAIKDVYSTYIASSDEYAKLIGLPKKEDVKGKTDYDMPCSGTKDFAHKFVQEDKDLIRTKSQSSLTTLNIHHYADGLKALVFNKKLIINYETNSILGIFLSAYYVDLESFLRLIPNFHLATRSTNKKPLESIKAQKVELNEYEQEICYLLLMNWELKQIANFMNEVRPIKSIRTADTIRKKRNYICKKLNLAKENHDSLINYLIEIDFQRQIPQAFLLRTMGSIRVFDERN